MFLPWLNSFFFISVSGSNLATHIVGSLKKGKSLTPIPPTNHAYNTLPSSHALSQHRTISESMISPSPNLSLPPNNHKRSPSSDSGNPGSRSTTPVSYISKIHGKFLKRVIFLLNHTLCFLLLFTIFAPIWFEHDRYISIFYHVSTKLAT